MGLFDFLRRSATISDQSIKKSEILVDTAKIYAISTYVSILDLFPMLQQISVEKWDFTITIAGTFAANYDLNFYSLKRAHQEELLTIVGTKLGQWHQDAFIGYSECCDIFTNRINNSCESKDKPQVILSDALGSWIFLSLFERQPKTENEFLFVRTAGGMVFSTFTDWWKK